MFPAVARLVMISSLSILIWVGSVPDLMKKFLRWGSNMELFLLMPAEVIEAMQFNTKLWTSVCDLKSLIMALATT